MRFPILLVAFITNLSLAVPAERTQRLSPSCALRLSVNLVEFVPDGDIVADVLFLNGFADESANHTLFFRELAKNGLRVLSFDYPSHGLTQGSSLNWFGFEDLARLSVELLGEKTVDVKRPLILSGWSTGGLLATTMLENPGLIWLGRRPKGAVLISPGISVKMFPGSYGLVTQRTLTSNPEPQSVGKISLLSPYLVPLFAGRLWFQSLEVQNAVFPKDVPTLLLTGGVKEDRYVNTGVIREWANTQRRLGAKVYSMNMDGASHALLAEPNVGKDVQDSFIFFARTVAGAKDEAAWKAYLGEPDEVREAN